MPTNINKPVIPIVEIGPDQAQKQAEVVRDGGPRRSQVLAGIIWLSLIGLLLLWPGDLLSKITWLDSGVCPQRASHSYFFDGRQMPLEARMVGIFGGYFVTLVGLWLVGRGRALQLPRRSLSIILGGLIAIMAFDGFNSTFWDLGWPTLYHPQNWLRVVTGAASGVGMAGLILPVFSLTIWRRGYLTPSFRRGREIVYALIAAGLLALGTILGWGPLFWPLSLLAVGGVVAMLVMFNFIILTIILRRENRLESARSLFTPLTLVLLVSLGQMVLFALFRVLAAGGSSFV